LPPGRAGVNNVRCGEAQRLAALVDVFPSVAASLAGQADQARPDSATAKADTDGGA